MNPPKKPNTYRYIVTAIFFLFMLLHQSDKLLIGPLTEKIQQEWNLSLTQVGAFSTGALVVGAICYPIWGYLYDRFSRAKLLALASAIWGGSTMLNAWAPNYNAFLVTRASTGIDDSSYPGLYSLIADYFGPNMRGKVYGVLQLTQPIGYLIGMILALVLGGVIGWRSVFYITGSLGIVLAVVIFFGVKDVPRGQSESELADLDQMGIYKFDWKLVGDLFKKPTLIMVFLQGFFGVFPWNVITYFFFLYLGQERGFDEQSKLITMGAAVLCLAAGYPIGGYLGDWLFKRTLRGRAIISTVGVVAGAVFLWLALGVPIEDKVMFTVLLCMTAITMPFASPNVISTVYDITLPEIRSTALAVESFIESFGAASAPLITGILAEGSSIQSSMLLICTVAWALCAVFFTITAFIVPKDIKHLHKQLQDRAALEQQHAQQA